MFLRVVISAFFFCVVLLQSAMAQDVRIAPKHLEFDKKDTLQTLTVNNSGSSVHAYKIETETRHMKEEGGSEVVNDSPYSCVNYLRLSPRRITVPPKSKEVLRVQVKSFNGMDKGDYFCHIRFTEIPTPSNFSESPKESNIAIPVTIVVGRGNLDMEIQGAEIIETKRGRMLSLDVIREGNKQGVGYIFASFQEGGSKKYIPIVERSSVKIYRNLDYKKVRAPLTNNLETELVGGKIKIELREGTSSKSKLLSEFELKV